MKFTMSVKDAPTGIDGELFTLVYISRNLQHIIDKLNEMNYAYLESSVQLKEPHRDIARFSVVGVPYERCTDISPTGTVTPAKIRPLDSGID